MVPTILQCDARSKNDQDWRYSSKSDLNFDNATIEMSALDRSENGG